jgi:cytoskeletal protein CcmA (bactofilin family)
MNFINLYIYMSFRQFGKKNEFEKYAMINSKYIQSEFFIVRNEINMNGNIIVDLSAIYFSDGSTYSNGTLNLTNNLNVGGDTDLSGNLNVGGDTDLSGNLNVDGDTDLSGNLNVDGDTDLSGNLNVGGYLNMSCNEIFDISYISFCDGTYIGPGSSFDISTNQILKILSSKNIFNANSIFNNNVDIFGDLKVIGDTTNIASTDLIIKDNIIYINQPYDSSGNPANVPLPNTNDFQSGFSVYRGPVTNPIGTFFREPYLFLFDNSSETFRIGISGDLQPVATREDSPINNSFTFWDSSNNRLTTETLMNIRNGIINLYNDNDGTYITFNNQNNTTQRNGFIGYPDNLSFDINLNNQEEGDIIFLTNNTERMRIFSNGTFDLCNNNLINTNIITTTILQDKDRNEDRLNFILMEGTKNIQQWFRFRRGGAIPSGDSGCIFSNFGNNNFFLYNNNSFNINYSDIDIDISRNGFGQTTPGKILFTLLNNGNVGIGNTNPTFLLDVSGTMRTNSVVINSNEGRIVSANDSLYIQSGLNKDKIRFSQWAQSSSVMEIDTSNGNIDINGNLINDVSGIFFSDGTFIGQGNSFDISANDGTFIGQGNSFDISANDILVLSGSGIITKNRIYQQIKNDPSWNNVNGYIGLAKDYYPGLNPYSSSVKAVSSWTSRLTNNNDNFWKSVCWSPELGIFVAVGSPFNVISSNIVMTSTDGINWTLRTAAAARSWTSVCWSPELSIFVAVASSGTNKVMTSPDGINWTIRTANYNSTWTSVCWTPELGIFVAVANAGTQRVMTSTNGIEWVLRNSAAVLSWNSVCWSPELGIFAAVAGDPSDEVAGDYSADIVMTSPDGLNWTTRTANYDSTWTSVCWSPELGIFVAVANAGTQRVMTSSDGINWTVRIPANYSQYRSVCWSPELSIFVAVSDFDSATRVMSSPDGINWTERISPLRQWNSVCWSPELGIFVSVAAPGQVQVMTSSLKGRPPTSYNVFDSSFNSIDQNGNWTMRDLNVTGTLNATTKNFKIPHPLLENKYLYHSCVESNDIQNIYTGKITLDNSNIILINLDEINRITKGTWERINRDPKIFLQNNSSFNRVKGNIQKNILSIQCENVCNDIIEWMVIAIRNDDTILLSNETDEYGNLITERYY